MAGWLTQVREGLFWSFRHSPRDIVRSPRFSATAIALLGVGLGVNFTGFYLLDEVVFKPLAVADPQQLVSFRAPGPNPGMDRNSERGMSFSWTKYAAFRDRAKSFEGVAARYGESANLQYGGRTERVRVELVSGNYFQVLGVHAAVGRVLAPEDNNIWRNSPYAVISHSLWIRRFDGDEGIVGKAIQINDALFTIIGVTPSDFVGVEPGVGFDVQVPMMMKSFITPTWPQMTERFWAWLNIIARRKPNVSIAQAQVESSAIYDSLLREEVGLLPAGWGDRKQEFLRRRIEVIPAARGLTWALDSAASTSKLLLGLVGGLLLIALLNLSGLVTIRLISRQKDQAVRLALGASKLRSISEEIATLLLICVIGGVIAIIVASFAVDAVSPVVMGDSAEHLSLRPDLRIVLFSIGISLVAMLALVIPVLVYARTTSLSGVVRGENRSSSSLRGVRMKEMLISGQVAAAVGLLLISALFIRTLDSLQRVPLGFDEHQLFQFTLDPPSAGYSPEMARSTSLRITKRLADLPGVRSTAASNFSLFGNDMNHERFSITGDENEETPEPIGEVPITPGYFTTTGMALLRGRDFTSFDFSSGRTVIVNESFAKRFFQDGKAIGRGIRVAGLPMSRTMEIVGIVRDARLQEVRTPAAALVFVPELYFAPATFYVRVSDGRASILADIRETLQAETPGLAIYGFARTQDKVQDNNRLIRMIAFSATVFGIVAAALAALGLYAVIAYSVSTRTPELGLRIALGARPREILRIVLTDVLGVVVIGLAVGLLFGLWGARLIERSLFGVLATDPLSATAAALVCGFAAFAGAFFAARRALRIDPAIALHSQ